MSDDRIPTEIWLTAQLRALNAQGVPHYLLHKGAYAAGTVMVKVVVRGQGAKLYSQSRDIDGNMGWMDVFEGDIVDESRADDYTKRSLQRDPDLWLIEVDDAAGKNPLEGKVF